MRRTKNHRRTASEKRNLIEKYLASAMTQKTFCQQYGLADSTFQLWLKKYRQSGKTTMPAQTYETTPHFIPLHFNPPPVGDTIIIEYPHGVVVRITQPVPLHVLTRLIQLSGE